MKQTKKVTMRSKSSRGLVEPQFHKEVEKPKKENKKADPEEVKAVQEIMEGVISDTTVPRNIRAAVQEAKDKLGAKSDDQSVEITGAIYMLDDISNDINMPSHARTEIWTIISRLETLREKVK